MQLIQIANKRKKTVINSSYENFVCKPRKKVQIKRLKNISLEVMPAFSDSGTGRVGYMGVTPWSLDDKKSVLATTVFHPDVFPTPPLVAVTIPRGYHFKPICKFETSRALCGLSIIYGYGETTIKISPSMKFIKVSNFIYTTF